MNENEKNMDENIGDVEVYTLEDENGEKTDFEVLASVEMNGKVYYAMIPYESETETDTFEEYIILRVDTDEQGQNMLVTIDDDDEFENVAAVFDNSFSEELDYGEEK